MKQFGKCPIGEEHRHHVYTGATERAKDQLSDLNLYHWSPRSRRKQILRQGLVPGKPSLQGDWKPPYVCFSDDVNLAWALSGALYPDIEEWDLWQVYPEGINQWEIIFDTYVSSGRHYIKEYRVYHRVYKRDVYYVASRSTRLPEAVPCDMMSL